MKIKTICNYVVAFLLSFVILFGTMPNSLVNVKALDGVTLTYSFTGEDAESAGYAQGTVELNSDSTDTYYLYWADDEKALDGYYEITTIVGSGSFTFDYHTAIPKGATGIIAVTSKSDLTVANAVARYVLPENKRLEAEAGKLNYTFASYSDVHIDPDGYYKNYEKNFTQALNFAAKKDTDFIVSSGDMVNWGYDYEWAIYEKLLADSTYKNPVLEADGNHDLRSNVTTGLKSFVRATATDNTVENNTSKKPYYYVREKTTGDLFIFMALEGGYKTHESEAFSQEQLNWLTNLLETYYDKGINIYLIEHSPIYGFGAGDRMENPWYGAHLSEEYASTVQFKALLQKYKDIIWMSGHTHIDYAMGYNYSNENNTACNMIHNSAVVGSTWAEPDYESADYNDGYGYNSQGYYVEVYDNKIVYYGANLTDEKIYPAYSYIMEGGRNNENPIGDADGNGDITIRDATTIQMHLAQIETLDSKQSFLSDVNYDNKLNIQDVTKIQRYLAKMITDFSQDYIKLSGVSENTDEALTKAEALLENQSSFASYEQYQDVKTLYNQYKEEETIDTGLMYSFDKAISNLENAVSIVGESKVYPAQKTYYFVNRLGWSEVYGYGWTNSTVKVSWPGEKLMKVGTYNGYDVYGIKFNQMGQCMELIFNNGLDGVQTVDIPLQNYKDNCFIDNNGQMSSGKYTVQNLHFDDSDVSFETPKYALEYYNGSAHAWGAKDTYFKLANDGTYQLDFTTTNSDSISCNVFNLEDNRYNCIEASYGFDYSASMDNTFTLINQSSRGKSITINNLSTGVKIKFIYNPTDNTLRIMAG